MAKTKQISKWCLGRESNPHNHKDRGILSPLRLPVPPPRRLVEVDVYILSWLGCQELHRDFPQKIMPPKRRDPTFLAAKGAGGLR